MRLETNRETLEGSVASFENPQKCGQRGGGYFDLLGDESEQLCDEPDLTPNVVSLQPPNLPLPHHVYRLIALNRSPGGVEFAEALLGVDAAFDCAMILFEDVIQVLNRSMATPAS